LDVSRTVLETVDETYPGKTRGIGLLNGENCMILSSTVLTDLPLWQTDRQTAFGWHHSALSYMLSRAKKLNPCRITSDL